VKLRLGKVWQLLRGCVCVCVCVCVLRLCECCLEIMSSSKQNESAPSRQELLCTLKTVVDVLGREGAAAWIEHFDCGMKVSIVAVLALANELELLQQLISQQGMLHLAGEVREFEALNSLQLAGLLVALSRFELGFQQLGPVFLEGWMVASASKLHELSAEDLLHLMTCVGSLVASRSAKCPAFMHACNQALTAVFKQPGSLKVHHVVGTLFELRRMHGSDHSFLRQWALVCLPLLEDFDCSTLCEILCSVVYLGRPESLLGARWMGGELPWGGEGYWECGKEMSSGIGAFLAHWGSCFSKKMGNATMRNLLWVISAIIKLGGVIPGLTIKFPHSVAIALLDRLDTCTACELVFVMTELSRWNEVLSTSGVEYPLTEAAPLPSPPLAKAARTQPLPSLVSARATELASFDGAARATAPVLAPVQPFYGLSKMTLPDPAPVKPLPDSDSATDPESAPPPSLDDTVVTADQPQPVMQRLLHDMDYVAPVTQQLFNVWSDAIMARFGELAPYELFRIIYSLARFTAGRSLIRPWFWADWGRAVTPLLHQMSRDSLQMSIWACRKLFLTPERLQGDEFFATWVDAMRPFLDECPPHRLVQMGVCLAKCEVDSWSVGLPFFESWCAQVARVLPSMEPHSLTAIVWTCAKLGLTHETLGVGFMSAWGKALEQRMSLLKTRELWIVNWSLAQMGLNSGSLGLSFARTWEQTLREALERQTRLQSKT
jgi:hypothetical protein